ncbi:MAG: hypothetical protein JWQ03_3114 [Variovorax sp.]|nr:hypothetical protein [Variovorax sp.]
MGQRIEKIGQSLSIGLTLPILAVGGAALKMGADFESAMNRVEAATGASGTQLKALRDQAKAFGADKSVTATAAQTADVMEALAKNGLNATQILGGTTAAVLKLAAANAAEFAPAADLTTDIMQQFGKQAGDMNGVVDKLTGGMLVSKFGFDDYRQALGQTGGVAGGLGLSFEDTNVALAATSALFSSGSDAGTSFKTFLTSLTPKSKEAGAMMERLGVSFYSANGQMKPLSEIAQVLKDNLAGLSDTAKTKALTTMFGTDAMRTAIGLMNQGADGLARIRGEIDKASAQDQMEARMKGWAGALTQVKKAFEAAAIALGDSGFLAGATAVLTTVGDLIRGFSALPAPVLQLIGVMATVAAVIGPVVLVAGKLVGVWGTVLTLGGRLAPMWAATNTALAASAASGNLAAASMTRLGLAMRFLTGPWGVVILGVAAALGYVYQQTTRAVVANDHLKAAADKVSEAQGRQRDTTLQLATALGNARAQLIAKAQADRLAAIQAIKTAKADLTAAMAARERARADAVKASAPTATLIAGADEGRAEQIQSLYADRAQRQADENAKQAIKNLKDWASVVDGYTAAINAPIASVDAPVLTNPDLSSGGSDKSTKAHGPSAEELARRRDELKIEVEIQAAQDRGDAAHAQQLQDQLDLQRRIKDWEDAGLSATSAKIAAEQDMATLQAARAARMGREVKEHQDSVNLQAAEITNNGEIVDSLTRSAEIRERILFYQEHGKTLELATAAAIAEQVRLDKERAAARDQMLRDTEAQRQIDLAKARGDTDQQIRAMESAQWIRERSEELQRAQSSGGAGLSKAAAEAQAATEAMQGEQARQQGIFRDTIKGGFRAALDGDFKSYFKNWLRDRTAKGMEEALNSLSDLIARLFSKVNLGGGGIGGALGSVLGALGIGGRGDATLGSSNPLADFKSIDPWAKTPGFARGGEFKVGGRSGIDQNMMAMRLTKGENVKITPANDRGGGGYAPVNVYLTVPAGVDLATRGEVARLAEATKTATMQAIAQANRRRG